MNKNIVGIIKKDEPMKVSDLIKELVLIVGVNGDIPVYIYGEHEYSEPDIWVCEFETGEEANYQEEHSDMKLRKGDKYVLL